MWAKMAFSANFIVKANTHSFILNFSPASCYAQLSEDKTIEIKHDIHPR